MGAIGSFLTGKFSFAIIYCPNEHSLRVSAVSSIFFFFFFNFLFGLDILRSGRGHFLKILFTHLFLYFRIWPKIKIRLDRRRRLGVGGRRQSSSRMDQSAAKVEWNIIIQGVH